MRTGLQRAMSPEDDAEATRDLSAELAFKPTEIDDPMINNWAAYTLCLVPDGWHFEGIEFTGTRIHGRWFRRLCSRMPRAVFPA